MPIIEAGAALKPTIRSSAGALPATVFLPKEHGSWSLALEPLALGLFATPSPAGAVLAIAALAGFFARRPLKAVLAPDSGRPSAAVPALLLLSALALAGLGEAMVLGGLAALWPLLLAAPLGGLFVWFDRQNESRAAAAELAGSATFALLPAAFATLVGRAWPAALARIALARSGPTVLTVRTYLRLGKGQPVDVTVPLAAGVLSVGVITALAWRHLVPQIAVVLVGLLLICTVFFVTSFRPDWPARRVGLTEAVLGVLYVGILGFACHLP